MFRYERPQKGRYRQFHQIDIEVIGSAEPLADAEVIACGWDILAALGVAEHVVLELNTLGDKESRAGLSRRAGRAISPSTRRRCRRTAWRGSTATRCASWTARTRATGASSPTAPTIAGLPHRGRRGVLCRRASAACDRFGVPFRENPRIVRGLDYYGHTAFEFVTTKLGAQGTVMGGGRYDGLVAGDGRPADARGRLGRRDRAPRHAAGATRPPQPPALPWSRSATRRRPPPSSVLQTLRAAGIRAEMAYRGNLRRRMERANRIGARAAVILGPDDIAAGVAQVKNLATGEQEAVKLADLAARLA